MKRKDFSLAQAEARYVDSLKGLDRATQECFDAAKEFDMAYDRAKRSEQSESRHYLQKHARAIQKADSDAALQSLLKQYLEERNLKPSLEHVRQISIRYVRLYPTAVLGDWIS